MWRPFFLSIGIATLLFGAQFLAVERFVLRSRGAVPIRTSWFDTQPKAALNKEFTPPPFLPWSLMSFGSVVCIYCFTLKKGG